MAASLSTIVAKDGNGTIVTGALQALDLSGAGTGPWSLANILVDGVAGTNRLAVTASNAMKVDGSGATQPVFGTVTANAGTNLNTSTLALETGGNLATLAGAVTASVLQQNVHQVNGVAPLMGNGVTGTGSQRVTIASDNTAFSVNATLQATATTAIGKVDPNTSASWALGAFASAMPANGQGIGLYDGTNMVRAKGDETSGIWVNIKAGAGSGGTAITDEAAFTEGTTSITPIGGVFKSSQTPLSTGQAGAVALSAAREMNTLGKIWDGTNTAVVKAASTAPVATDPAVVVAISPNSVNANGQNTMANGAPVSIASDQKWQTGMSPKAFSAAFTTLTRPANTTAYTAGDSISNNATAGSVTALSATVSDTNNDPVTLTEILIASTDTGLAGKRVRAYLFNSDPTASTGVGGGDNAAYLQKQAGYIGSMSGVLEAGFSDGTVGRLVPSFNDSATSPTPNAPAGGFIISKPTSGAETIFIQFQAIDGFTPSANSTTIIATARGFQGRAS